MKQGVWITYDEEGEKTLTPYREGEPSGIIKKFYKNDSLKIKTKFQENKIIFRMTYYKNGTIKREELFKNGSCIKVKIFNADGRLIKTY